MARHSNYYILVHGAWMGSWCWAEVVDRLRSQGHDVDPVDMPGRSPETASPPASLDAYSQVVEDAIHAAGRQVIVVGHSFGGIVATQAAERVSSHVDTLVYLTAFVPRPGVGLMELASTPEFSSSLALEHAVINESNGTQTMPAEYAPKVLFNMLGASLAEQLSTRLVPEGLAAQLATPMITDADTGAGALHRVYIECTEDHAIPLQAQRAMAAAAGIADVRTIRSDHSPFFSNVGSLVDHLNQLGI